MMNDFESPCWTESGPSTGRPTAAVTSSHHDIFFRSGLSLSPPGRRVTVLSPQPECRRDTTRTYHSKYSFSPCSAPHSNELKDCQAATVRRLPSSFTRLQPVGVTPPGPGRGGSPRPESESEWTRRIFNSLPNREGKTVNLHPKVLRGVSGSGF
jgi:hypothetical protein